MALKFTPPLRPRVRESAQERRLLKLRQRVVDRYQRQAALLNRLWNSTADPVKPGKDQPVETIIFSLEVSRLRYWTDRPDVRMNLHWGTDPTGPDLAGSVLATIERHVTRLQRFAAAIRRQQRQRPASLQPIQDYHGERPEYAQAAAEQDYLDAVGRALDQLQDQLPAEVSLMPGLRHEPYGFDGTVTLEIAATHDLKLSDLPGKIRPLVKQLARKLASEIG